MHMLPNFVESMLELTMRIPKLPANQRFRGYKYFGLNCFRNIIKYSQMMS
jgi:hypothetical protein